MTTTAVALPRNTSTSERLKSLDGLRAVSIIMVLVGHLNDTRNFGSYNFGIGNYGHLGVVVFFVISGFLITSLLLSEDAKKGRVSLKLFYMRRALRIFPASYAYIACMSALWAAGLIMLDRTSLLSAVTYTMNYVPHPSWRLGHLWSLSVEEQFYLLWPPVFVILGRRRAPWAAGCVIALAPVARALGWLAFRHTLNAELPMFPMVADSLAAGCLLVCVRSWLERQRWYLELFRPVYSLILVALILITNRYMGYGLGYVFGTSFINISLAVLIHRSVYYPGDWVGTFLNWKPVAALGVLSYSLYLWQQPFLDRTSTVLVNSFPINIVLAFAAALASYILLERPLLKLRHRLRA